MLPTDECSTLSRQLRRRFGNNTPAGGIIERKSGGSVMTWERAAAPFCQLPERGIKVANGIIRITLKTLLIAHFLLIGQRENISGYSDTTRAAETGSVITNRPHTPTAAAHSSHCRLQMPARDMPESKRSCLWKTWVCYSQLPSRLDDIASRRHSRRSATIPAGYSLSER